MPIIDSIGSKNMNIMSFSHSIKKYTSISLLNNDDVEILSFSNVVLLHN
jgi:hypothetical protein